MRAFVGLVFLVSAVWAVTNEHYKEKVRPFVEICKKRLSATDDEANAFVDLDKHLFTYKAKCLAACALEEIGTMKNGKWGTVPEERRRELYNQFFEGDAMRLAAAESVISVCEKEGDLLHPGQEEGCETAYAAIECLWRFTY